MSFGLGIGDFLAVLQILNKIRKDYSDAPDQFAALSDEVGSLSTVLQYIQLRLQILSDEQKVKFDELVKSCHHVLVDLKTTLEKYVELEPDQKDVGKRIKRVWKRLNWDHAEVQHLQDRVTVNINLVNAFQASIIYQTSQETKTGVDQLNERQDAQERRREKFAILDWITLADYVAIQSDFIQRRQKGTGQWLLDSCEFRTWLMTKGQVLFCPGIPGAGKTILTSVVVDELTTRLKADSSIGIAYVYCNYRRRSEQNAKQLLSSLLRQLLHNLPSMPDSVKKLYDEYGGRRAPTLGEISTFLRSVCTLCSRVFILVDALDECQVADGCLSDFLSEIFALQGTCAANVFATSRFIPEITKRFDNNLTLEIRAQKEDIERYLENKIARSGLSLLEKCSEDIKTKITQAVDGMFLLAQLYFDAVQTKKTVKKIKAILNSFSAEQNAYDNTYDEAMKRIQGLDNDSQELAMQVLSWIACAETQFKVNELQTALAIEEGESELDEENEPQVEDMVSVCAGLVTIDEQSDVIRLVHYTTQEYFERTRQQWFPEADRNAAIKCLTYLSFATFESGSCSYMYDWNIRIKINPFFLYAACNWGRHVRQCSGLLHQVLAFFEQDNKMQAAAQALLDTEFEEQYLRCEIRSNVSGLHLAAYFGLLDAIHVLLESGQDANLLDGFRFTPLMYASANGHEAAVSLILESIPESLGNFYSPLSLAAAAGYEGVVKIFLAFKGIDISMKNENYGRVLCIAVSRGHETIVRLFLADKRIDATLNGTLECELLSCAAKNGYENLVKLFLARKGVVADSRGNRGWTPLMGAAHFGYERVVKLLLSEQDVNPDTRDIDGRTPLSHAAGRGNEAIVRLLLETGAVDLDSRCNSGRTPLMYALMAEIPIPSKSLHGCMIACARLLTSGKVDPDSKSNQGNTPLILATQNGYIGFVELLLGLQVDPRHQNNNGESALWWAAESGSLDIVRLLLKIPSVDPNAEDKRGSTALSRAALHGHRNVVELLLADSRVDPHIKDKKGRSLLFYAAYNRDKNIEMVKMIFNMNKATADSRDDDGRTPLSWAASSGSFKTTRLLLEEGNADANSIDAKGKSVLWHAATTSKDVVKLLLCQPGVDVNTADNIHWWTPLMRAACSNLDIVEKLLAVDSIDVNFKDNYLRTALSWAARKRQYPIVKLLLASKDIETDFPDIDGRTPLSLAAQARDGEHGVYENGHYLVFDGEHSPDFWRLSAVKLLLSEGRANPNSKDATGRSPLSWAAQGGDKEIVCVLIDAMGESEIDQTDNGGKTPMSYAVKNKHDEIVKMLLDRGARPVEFPKDSVLDFDAQPMNSWRFKEEPGKFEETSYKEDEGFSLKARDYLYSLYSLSFIYD